MKWRAAAARARDLAPATVLPDHLAKNCAYSMPTTAAALRELGVRFGAGADDLAALIDRACRELGLSVAVSADEDTGVTIALPRGPRSFAAWPLAVEKPSKKPKAWDVYCERLSQGESCSALAANQASGKAIQTADRREARAHGPRPRARGGPRAARGRRRRARPAPCGAPTVETSAQVRGRGASGGRRPLSRREVRHRALARAYDDGAVSGMADVDYKDRTDAQKIAWNAWSNSRNWWEALVRVGWDPDSSEPAAKKPRVV